MNAYLFVILNTKVYLNLEKNPFSFETTPWNKNIFFPLKLPVYGLYLSRKIPFGKFLVGGHFNLV